MARSFIVLIVVILAAACRNEKTIKSIEGFQIQNGFDIALVAQEPLLTDPVDLEFDENGNAFVLEMPG